MTEEALQLFAVSYAYHRFPGQAWLLRSESRSRIEYLILTNNIIVLDWYFNLIINLISLTGFNTIQYDFLIIIGSGLLFVATLYINVWFPCSIMLMLSFASRIKYMQLDRRMLHSRAELQVFYTTDLAYFDGKSAQTFCYTWEKHAIHRR